MLENILENYKGDRSSQDYLLFEEYAKRVFFSNGVHHHYAESKFFPACSKEYFASLMEAVGAQDSGLLDFIYDPQAYPQRRATGTDGDIVSLSAVNFYEGVTREEVEKYYASIMDENDPRPVSYGLNSKIVKGEDGTLREERWKVGGIYSDAITRICAELEAAAAVAEHDSQKEAISMLVDYYTTGDLRKWDEFNVAWVKDTLGKIDVINGFIEDDDDPL